MLTEQRLVEYALTFPDVYRDMPFHDDTVYLRCRGNKKGFCMLLHRAGRLYVNLKCSPQEAEFYRRVYRDVIPGWHMNKTHWNTVFLNGDVPEEEVLRMLRSAHALVAPRRRKREGEAAKSCQKAENQV